MIQQNKGADSGLQEVTGSRTRPPLHRRDYGGESPQLQVPLGSHQRGPDLDSPHPTPSRRQRDNGSSSSAGWTPGSAASPGAEYPDWLHHRLVWQVHHPQPKGSTEGGENCSAHHQDGAAIHGGPQHPEVQEEGQQDHQRPKPPQPQTVLPADDTATSGPAPAGSGTASSGPAPPGSGTASSGPCATGLRGGIIRPAPPGSGTASSGPAPPGSGTASSGPAPPGSGTASSGPAPPGSGTASSGPAPPGSGTASSHKT
ncbi:basic proline-rich protein-like isoform X2 [Siniperca chuatsi]|uniref:basic proline-rich protein-like isoform X2 n=1 Tax=Siniperca chuatsi TaxID=119488 RepID=UPI001CE1AD3E|nr:basic proline-rich protein-like isoform X2 [Siniperca chuatsi]